MTEEKLVKINRTLEALKNAKTERLRFIRNHSDFEAMHWQFPWSMFSDEEWEQMMEVINERSTQRVADLENKFAAL